MSWSDLGASWGGLGAVLGRLAAVMVGQEPAFGGLGAVLAALGAVMERSWPIPEPGSGQRNLARGGRGF